MTSPAKGTFSILFSSYTFVEKSYIFAKKALMWSLSRDPEHLLPQMDCFDTFPLISSPSPLLATHDMMKLTSSWSDCIWATHSCRQKRHSCFCSIFEQITPTGCLTDHYWVGLLGERVEDHSFLYSNFELFLKTRRVFRFLTNSDGYQRHFGLKICHFSTTRRHYCYLIY